jgi:hypothetical protein
MTSASAFADEVTVEATINDKRKASALNMA